MDKDAIFPFIDKKVRLERRNTSNLDPYRTFKITGFIKQVYNDSISFYTDHTGIIALSEIVGIELLE